MIGVFVGWVVIWVVGCIFGCTVCDWVVWMLFSRFWGGVSLGLSGGVFLGWLGDFFHQWSDGGVISKIDGGRLVLLVYLDILFVVVVGTKVSLSTLVTLIK